MVQPLSFVVVRIRQAVRELQAMGPVYSLILILSILIGLFLFYISQDGSKNTLGSCILLLGVILTIHFSRSDHRFMKLNVVNHQLVFFVEYSAFLLPFLVLIILKTGSILILLILLPVFIISLKSSVKIIQKGLYVPVKLFGRRNFEWKAGFRKTGWPIFIIWVTALCLTPVPFVSMIILWFMLLLISSFYEEHETREMVEAFELSPMKFIAFKIGAHVILFMVPAVVVLLASLYFYPNRWWIYLLFLVYSCVNIAVFIVSKYAVFGAGETHRSVTVTNIISLLGFFLPFLFPVPLFILIKNTRKAVNRLSPLLHDFAK